MEQNYIRQHIRYINGHKFITKTNIKNKNTRQHIWFDDNGNIKTSILDSKIHK